MFVFSASGSKRFEILSFSSISLTLIIFLRYIRSISVFFANLKGNSVFFSLYVKRPNTPEKDRLAL
ncbi:hypothetical protein Hanom_Chr09g00835121 [Helianthus anomalus]